MRSSSMVRLASHHSRWRRRISSRSASAPALSLLIVPSLLRSPPGGSRYRFQTLWSTGEGEGEAEHDLLERAEVVVDRGPHRRGCARLERAQQRLLVGVRLPDLDEAVREERAQHEDLA